jgi:hypothetical protein
MSSFASADEQVWASYAEVESHASILPLPGAVRWLEGRMVAPVVTKD